MAPCRSIVVVCIDDDVLVLLFCDDARLYYMPGWHMFFRTQAN
jgi:hypothetical protein